MSEALLRLLLRAAPRRFRDRHGEEVLELHRERAVLVRARRARVWFGIREVAGLAVAAVRLRLHAVGQGSMGTTKRGGESMLRSFWQDVRYGARALARNPGFSAAAVVVLALGIGANTAIFSAANAFFFRPLPFADPDRLVALWETNPEFGWTDAYAAPANVLDWREQVDAFEDVGAYNEFLYRSSWVGADGEPRLFAVATVTGNFFDVLGVRPEAGRTFRWDETWAPNDDVVVLSHALWVSQFGADPGIVGRTLELGSTQVQVVGIMPEGFVFPSSEAQLWTPWGWTEDFRANVSFRRAHWVRPVARLKPGVTLADADAQLHTVVRRLSIQYPETNKAMGAGLAPLRSFLIRNVRPRLELLSGAVALLLLLACANVANLVLVRGAGRSREVALRFALGAGRGRVVRQMLTESLLLALGGGVLGLGLGWGGVRLIERMTPLGIDGATALALDARVVLFVVAATTLSGVLFGLAPALRSTAADVHDALKKGARGGSPGPARGRTVNVLVGLEVALALVLVIGAGLMVRSYWLLRDVNPGFDVEGTLAVQFSLPASRYPERDDVLAFYDRFLERLEASPGIARAGSVGGLPLSGASWSSQFQAEGWPPERVGFEILHRRADRGYFEALGVPLVRGRWFGPEDRESPPVVLVNETFARQHFPGEDPIGQRVAWDRRANENPDAQTWYEIVGIVGDQSQVSPGEAPRAEVFEDRDQDWDRGSWIVIRTDGDPLAALPTVRAVLRELDPLIPLGRVRPLHEVWRTSMAREEFILTLLGAFGVVALLLAAVGVYGVTAQAARARTQEIGIRMALGAAAPSVLGMMVRQGMRVVGLGLAAGLLASLLAGRVLGGFLYGVEPTDPWTLMAVVAAMAAVAALACYLPARRATVMDPVRSLRAE